MKKDKIKSLVLLLITFISILSIVISKPLGDLDELWNYNFARNVSSGLVPYKDFNMLQMPLLPMICGLLLKIISNQLFVMRIIAALICSLIMFLVCKIFKLLKINNNLLIIIMFFIGYLYHDIFCVDYNWMSLLVVLLIIYYETIKYKENGKLLVVNLKTDILIGILAGLTFALKQTSGFLICAAVIGNKLISVKNKEDFKLFIKSSLFRTIGILFPVLIIFTYLLINNAFDDFISYTLKGASSFTNYISYGKLLKPNIIGLLSILVPIIIIYELYNVVIKTNKKQLYFLYVYGLSIFIIGFPISDKIHFVIGSTPIIILMIFEIYSIIEKIYIKFIRDKEMLKSTMKILFSYINFILILTIIIYSYMNYCKFIKSNYSDLNHYKYIIINKALENEISKVDDYILKNENDVIIADAQAAVYMIPIDKYHKNFDMFLKGNLGFNGEQEIIDYIKENTNIKYLLLKNEYNLNWQTPIKIIDFVKKNKENVGEIGIFEIYE